MAKSKLTFKQYMTALTRVAGRSFRMSPAMAVVQVADSIIRAALPIATTYFAALTTTALAGAYAEDQEAADTVLLYVIITAVLGVIMLFWQSVSSFISQKTRYRIQASIEDEMMAKFTQLPFPLYDDKRVVDLHEKARRFSYMFGYVFDTIGSMFTSLVGAIGSMLALMVISPWLSLIVLVSVVPGIFIQIRLARDQTNHWEGNITNRRRMSNINWTLQRPSMIAEMRIYGVVRHLIDIHAKLREKDDKERLDFELKTIWKQLAADVGTAVVELGALIWVTLQIVAREQPVGQFLYVQQMVGRALGEASGLARQLGRMDEDLANVVHYQDFMDLSSSDDTGEPISQPESEILVENVSFSYPGTDRTVLSDVSIEINKGARVAIVGENGAGKSTLIKLIMGLYQPVKGSISVDGVDLRQVDVGSWHKQISLLGQEFASYDFATMRENITLGNVDVEPSDQAIQDAVKMAEFKDVVDSHSHGLDTYIERWMAIDDDSSTATDLSGGQSQRLALARNFYRNAPVVILDEPTSAIDALAESRIFSRLFKQKNKTIIIISHRLTVVEKADIIYMMEDGQVVERGTHKELVALNGRYHRMFESQLSSDNSR